MIEMKKYKIKDFAKTCSGGTPTSSRREFYEGGTIPWINSGELSQSFITNTSNYITELGYNSSSAKMFPKDDTVLLAMYGATAGKASLLQINACTNQAICAIIPDKSVADPLYLKYKLDTMYDYLVRLSSGSARDNLSQAGIANLEVDLPPLSVQQKVASVLSSLDKKIALNKQINQNLEALARQLYDYWFVQFDFPNEEGKPYKSSGGKMVYNPILKREIPEGWEVKTINEIAQSTRGVTYNKSDLVNQGVDSILVLRGNNIEGNSLVYDGNVAYVPHTLVAASQRIKKFDIIMTMSSGSKAHIGKCVLFNCDSPDTFGAFLNKFSAPQEYAYLLFLHFISNEFKSKIQSICNGTGINNLTNESFNHILLPTANEEIRKHFKAVCAPIFDSIGKNELEIVSLTKQRDELLPLLMNGQVNFDLSDD